MSSNEFICPTTGLHCSNREMIVTGRDVLQNSSAEFGFEASHTQPEVFLQEIPGEVLPEVNDRVEISLQNTKDAQASDLQRRIDALKDCLQEPCDSENVCGPAVRAIGYVAFGKAPGA